MKMALAEGGYVQSHPQKAAPQLPDTGRKEELCSGGPMPVPARDRPQHFLYLLLLGADSSAPQKTKTNDICTGSGNFILSEKLNGGP